VLGLVAEAASALLMRCPPDVLLLEGGSTAAAVAAAILGGAHIVRVHAVREMIAAAQVADAVYRARLR